MGLRRLEEKNLCSMSNNGTYDQVDIDEIRKISQYKISRSLNYSKIKEIKKLTMRYISHKVWR